MLFSQIGVIYTFEVFSCLEMNFIQLFLRFVQRAVCVKSMADWGELMV